MSSINIKFPLKLGEKDAFETNDVIMDAIKDDLRILLLTNHGERPVHADYGANLRRLIFNQSPDVIQESKELIAAAIEKWMPFIVLTDVQVLDSVTDSTIRDNELRIKIKFKVNQLEGTLTQTIRG